MNKKSTKAIILSAGRGKRMRYKTSYIAKPLIKIQNKTLLEINLKKFSLSGIRSCVINKSYNYKTVDNFIKNYSYKNAFPKIITSYEKRRLETGGGIKNAIKLFDSNTILAVNGDSILINEKKNCPIKILYTNFDPKKMDILLLLTTIKNSIGYSGKGDFVKNTKKKLFNIKRKTKTNSLGLVFTGWQLVKKDLFKKINLTNFSLNILFNQAEKNSKLFGIVHPEYFLHLNTPKSILQVERFLKKNKKVL